MNASRSAPSSPSAIRRGSCAASSNAATAVSTPATSSAATASRIAMRISNGAPPSAASTDATVTGPPPASTRSSKDSESRADPAAARATIGSASGSKLTPSSASTDASRPLISSTVRYENSKCCVRERIVGNTFSGSVVARMKTTCAGGSSSVFSSVLDASFVSMWTSSRRYTLRFEVAPSPRLMRATRSRASSTPRLDAASISIRSPKVPAAMETQFSHCPHGSPSGPSSRQLSALARMRAVVVLPLPRGPEKR